MNLALFVIVLVTSFIVVRIGAIAFQLTGLEWTTAKFQSLSCFTSTGFTTKEAELVTTHPQRRRIASALIVLGHAGLVTMIATLANSLRAPQVLERKLSIPLLPYDLPPFAIQIINLLIMILAVAIIFKVFSNSKVTQKVTDYLRQKVIRRGIIRKVTFEELLVATGGYGVLRYAVTPDCTFVSKTLAKSELRQKDITVLAITRLKETFPNPSADIIIKPGDELICFGNLQSLHNHFCGS